jgi:nucleoid-associated protein YgaU
VQAYPVIVDATNAKAKEDSSFTEITNPDLIEIGQKLWIPDVAP